MTQPIRPTLWISLCAAALLAACGGAGDSAAEATAAGCTGKVATLFAAAKGSYSAKAATFDNVNFASTPASVAGFANGGTQTVTVSAGCTITVGSVTLSYKDASYAEFAGSGADLGKTQYDVDLTGGGVLDPHFEVFTSAKRGLSLFDATNKSQGVRFDE